MYDIHYILYYTHVHIMYMVEGLKKKKVLFPYTVYYTLKVYTCTT